MELININTASLTKLTRLPLVGRVRAGEIVQWREQNGYFASIESLIKVPGIGEGILGVIRTKVTSDCAFFVFDGQHVVFGVSKNAPLTIRLESVLNRRGHCFLKHLVINFWLARKDQSEFEFEWIKKLTLLHSEVLSELPPIPSVINVHSTREYVDQIKPVWEREHQIGRLLNSLSRSLSLVIDWLQPRARPTIRRFVQSYGVGIATMMAIADWELSFRVLFKAVLFPVTIVNGLGYVWVGGNYNYVYVLLLVTFVIVIERRQGLRAAILVWILMLIS